MDPNLQEAFQTNQIEEFSLSQDHIETLIHIYSQIFPKFEQGARSEKQTTKTTTKTNRDKTEQKIF